MSRSDQYIGLTKKAQDFLRGIQPIAKVEQVVLRLAEDTLCGQEIYGVKYILHNGEEEFLETIQEIPWSSGPMYFTCLTHIFYKGEILSRSYTCFEWWTDLFLKGTNQEYDYETGGMYV